MRIGYFVNGYGDSTLRGVKTLPISLSDLKIKLDAAGNFRSFKSGARFNDWNTRILNRDKNGRSLNHAGFAGGSDS